jgi:hypothetical protein
LWVQVYQIEICLATLLYLCLHIVDILYHTEMVFLRNKLKFFFFKTIKTKHFGWLYSMLHFFYMFEVVFHSDHTIFQSLQYTYTNLSNDSFRGITSSPFPPLPPPNGLNSVLSSSPFDSRSSPLKWALVGFEPTIKPSYRERCFNRLSYQGVWILSSHYPCQHSKTYTIFATSSTVIIISLSPGFTFHNQYFWCM